MRARLVAYLTDVDLQRGQLLAVQWQNAVLGKPFAERCHVIRPSILQDVQLLDWRSKRVARSLEGLKFHDWLFVLDFVDSLGRKKVVVRSANDTASL